MISEENANANQQSQPLAKFNHPLKLQLTCIADALRLLPGSDRLVDRLEYLERLVSAELEHLEWLQRDRNQMVGALKHNEKVVQELRLKLEYLDVVAAENKALDSRNISKLNIVAQQLDRLVSSPTAQAPSPRKRKVAPQ